MTFGEKLKEARKKIGLSQEQLAEKLNISRSAVAKWESDIGIPDVSNLKSIAKLLNVSIDSLLDVETDTSIEADTSAETDASAETDTSAEADTSAETDTDVSSENKFEKCPEYAGYYQTIELVGWNDGVYNVIVLGQDKRFLYYKIREKRQYKYGLIGKKYITSVSKGNKIKDSAEEDTINIDSQYFCNRHVKLEVACDRGLIKGFFDFTNDNYLDIVIKSFDDKKVILSLGQELDTEQITKIEEI